jgi:hypothetical protein
MKTSAQKMQNCLKSFMIFVFNLIIITAPCAFSKESKISYTIPYVESAPEIDGVISEGEWAGAEHVFLDNETEPSQNVPAIVETEVLLMEDGANFYLAFIADDPEFEGICASYSDRDTCWDDDLVGVVIDTFNDERRAFEFFANPLGVQIDRINNESGGNGGPFGGIDNSWNAIWDSAGRISDKGYVVEMKIPLTQLRFSAGLDRQTWGIDLVRYYPRNKRHKFSNNTLDYNLSCYLCQLKKAQGFNQLEEKLNLQIVPTFTASYAETRQGPGNEWEDEFDPEIGLDIRWGINQDFYLNATINPDFSQVEADVAQVDVNNTFSLFNPERREFFLDGADYFSTVTNLVYTRNILFPNYGIKLTGKRDMHSFGFFFADDQNTNMIIPGRDGSIIASLPGVESLNTAYRYRLDINTNMNFGMIFTDRRADNYSNTVAGVDSNIRIGKSDSIQMQLMKSYSEYPDPIQDLYGQRQYIDDYAYLFNYRHEDNNWFWMGSYNDFGNDFRADMGFINQVDYRNYDISGGHNWRFGPGNGITRFFLGADYEKSYDESGLKLEEKAGMRINVEGPMQSFMFLGYNQGDHFYNGKYFDEYSIFLFGHIRPSSYVEIGMDFDYGDSIDYLNTRLGRMLTINPEINLQLGKHFQAKLRHSYQKMDIEGVKLYTTNLSDFRTTYQFTVRSFLRVIVQYSNTTYNQSLYTFPIDSRSRFLTSQILYSYKINPQTRFFIGYAGSGFRNDDMSKIFPTNRTLFAKFSYCL